MTRGFTYPFLPDWKMSFFESEISPLFLFKSSSESAQELRTALQYCATIIPATDAWHWPAQMSVLYLTTTQVGYILVS